MLALGLPYLVMLDLGLPYLVMLDLGLAFLGDRVQADLYSGGPAFRLHRPSPVPLPGTGYRRKRVTEFSLIRNNNNKI